ncbi:hypothetical protein LTS03_008627 [Exophiala xenobiotica]|nr:hypothetical protein LTR41_001863 [Exophiala xenobiotica]KAK5547965.1 hypothetical protein LTR23_002214 [Chaetothyriales sp. CCFEE 6169]KAK5222096.1 hypothetical protein LTR72_006353 [Exophiala xenobiotica]KAK5295131.1 hypothetical protein LTR14_004301 [Exophiala xenobiotica]KAK5366714.1 hypothetical protein LTS03_008627 [Exophiala xenobiotica]
MDKTSDAKVLVREGYNKIAETYQKWTLEEETLRTVFLEKLFSHIGDTSTAKVLELGCGAGIPATRLLADHFQHVVANDISDAQIDLARTNVPQANVTFVREDMTQLTFEDDSLSAVVAFYSIIHLPREEQPAMLQQIWTWLTPGGILLCNLGVSDDPGTMNEDWLGARMYWSSFNAAANIEQLKKAGFAIVESEVLSIKEDGDMVPFLWILAKKGCLEAGQGLAVKVATEEAKKMAWTSMLSKQPIRLS